MDGCDTASLCGNIQSQHLNSNLDTESAWRGAARRSWEERQISEELGEKWGVETPLGVLQDCNVFVRGMWIQVGFTENGQTVAERELSHLQPALP